ncbi:hypothetical protein [Streptomyces albireticuli]|uniref:Uncharacterized protein n=1 Tax=Streptomyces albireticuli TaxID=1940 RepID=A0A2A2DAN9_9ACTN|nr:hypothetical protein [Streptomyces albireticuli]MCD9141598.1 hypothetical protein [Streptomyces albireticuli]MCD9164151.1 hypothetical protein [Streptomyces albireticuli]MCD9189772.1 hypothetical protein [Streptomyces albireticuli]PAU49538.1 hypothetical protein CK936_07215 [Streptomyces albireticuli]
MALRFVGKDPESGDHGSPAVWVDESTKDLLLQGWEADDQTRRACAADVSQPDHEAVIRVPKRMVQLLREALDVAELE